MGKVYDSVGINQREIELQGKEIRKLERDLRKNLSQAKVIVPFTMYGGFKDFSEMGELGTLNKINDHSAYQRVFTGASSVVAIWDNSVELVNTPVSGDIYGTTSSWSYIHDNTLLDAFDNTITMAANNREDGTRVLSWDEARFSPGSEAGFQSVANIPDDAKVMINIFSKLVKADGVTRMTWADIKPMHKNSVMIIDPIDNSGIPAAYKFLRWETIHSRKLEKRFQTGDYMVGISFSSNLSSNVDNFSEGKDFTEMHDTESITVIVPAHELSENDLYKVFILPQESQRWLRITDVNRIKDTSGNIIFSEITFSSFNDVIESTGPANFNYVQRAAIGENYAWPVIDGDEIKHTVLGGEGVNEYQVEFLGNVLVHGLGFIGRDAHKNEIKEPKWLLTSEMLTPIESKVKRVSAAENNLLLLRDCKFTEKTYFKKWKDEMQQGYDATVRKQYEGMISFDNKTTQLNKDVADKNFWDKSVTYDLSGGAIHYDGFASPYVRKNFDVASETVPGLLNRNLLCHSWMTQLPQEIDETIAWRAADLPVIGKLINFFTAGVPFGWKHSNTLMKAKGLNFLGSRAQALMYSTAIFAVDKSVEGVETGLLPAEAFDNTEENPIGKMTASQSVSIVLRGKLTDTVTTDGVDKDTDSMKTTANTFNEKSTAKTVNNKYWYIDKHVMNIVGKADYIVTYFRDGVRVWSSRYQTTGKWTKNIRDWLNFVSYSPWNEFEADQEGLNWNHIEDLPAPQGSSFYEPKTFFSTERRVDASGGWGLNIDHEVKWQVSKNIWDRFSKIFIPGMTNVQYIDKTEFEKLNGQNVHNFVPHSDIYPTTVLLTIDKTTNPSFVIIKLYYVSKHQIQYHVGTDYQAFKNALGDQLRELTLYNEGS